MELLLLESKPEENIQTSPKTGGLGHFPPKKGLNWVFCQPFFFLGQRHFPQVFNQRDAARREAGWDEVELAGHVCGHLGRGKRRWDGFRGEKFFFFFFFFFLNKDSF